MKYISPFVIGAIFGLGIVISGMANPAKVLNFFDIAGSWDPSLVFVMGGALITTAIGYRAVFSTRERPLFGENYMLPASRRIDWRLIGGASLFGIGWGIAGFCPGGAIPTLGLGYSQTLVFVAAMVAGLAITRAFDSKFLSAARA